MDDNGGRPRTTGDDGRFITNIRMSVLIGARRAAQIFPHGLFSLVFDSYLREWDSVRVVIL